MNMRIPLFILYVIGFMGVTESASVCLQHKNIFSSVLHGYISDGNKEYKSSQRCEWLIQSPNKTFIPYISLEFSPNTTECGYDFIFVHDGTSDKDPILASLSGNLRSSMQERKIVAKSGQMLVRLISDKNTEYDGFNASFTMNQCINNCSGKGDCKVNRCSCYFGWAGNDCSQSVCPNNCGSHGRCRRDTENKKCSCWTGFIGKECDVNVNGGHHDNRWSVVYDYSGEHGSEGRAGHAGCYIESYFYVFGGYDLSKPLSQLLKYNFEMNEWFLLESSTQPAARFYHTMSPVLSERPYLFLFGGQLENEDLSKETWTFDTVSNIWTKHMPLDSYDSPSPVCQHAAAVVHRDHEIFIYIFGGRWSNSQDFGLSADMLRFNFHGDKWEKLRYNKNGISSTYKLQMSGHSMVYDKIDDNLVVFGGYRIDDDRKASLSSAILLYSVPYNRWSELKPSYKSWSYSIEPLGFHTANVVGDYMIIHGGKKNHHAENKCFSRHTHFYHLRSQTWIRTLSNEAVSSPMKLFGHTADVVNDKVLLVHGGYFGVMSNVLRAYRFSQLPKSTEDSCTRHRNKISCQSSFPMKCTWKGNSCRSKENLKSIYGSVCSSMKDCLSCTTHSSYKWNVTGTWEAQRCVWCVQDGACYSQDQKGTSNCGIIKRIRDGTPWWTNNQSLLLQDPKQCFTENIRPGAVVMEYDGVPDFLRPDNATLLDKVAIEWKNSGTVAPKFARILGFLKIQQIDKSYMHIQLGAVKGAATFSLSSSISSAKKKVLATLKQTDGYASVKSNPILIKDFEPMGSYFEVTFNHSINDRWNGKVEVAIGFSDFVTDLVEFRPLTYAYLEQYQSSVAFKSSQTRYCRALTNCLSCLSDASCGWCYTQSKCIERSTMMGAGGQCAKDSESLNQTLKSIIVDLEFCERCSVLMTCNKCVEDIHCGWDETTGGCVRKGRKDYLVTESVSCPALCSQFHDCESCMSSKSKDGTTTGCSWCVMNQMCYRSSRHHLPAYTFGECAFWVDRLEQCPICTRHTDCKGCLETYGCGWCSDVSNPLLGYCSQGGFLSPHTICESKFLPNTSLIVNNLIWSYSSCPDVDECLVGEWPKGKRLNMCHENATCSNTDGSYECTCNKGFEGNGWHCKKSCMTDCGNGQCSGPPYFECICDLGWTSDDYDDGFACNVDCKCNFLSSCSNGSGTCDFCQRNSSGPDCGGCQNGYFRSEILGCNVCECNGHGIAARGFCDQNTGFCFCQDHTEGRKCELCAEGYYGDPTNGSACYRKCDSRIEVTDNHGFLGSYEATINLGSLVAMQTKDIMVHCEWIILAKENPAFIKITLDRTLLVPCYVNKVLVYEGRPNSEDFHLVGEFCGNNWRHEVMLYTVSGSATIRFQNVFRIGRKHLHGFTAEYNIMPICSAISLNSNSSIDNSQSLSVPNNSESCHDITMSQCAISSVLNRLVEYQPIEKNLLWNISNKEKCFVSEQSFVQIEWTQSHASTIFPPPSLGSVAVGLDNCIWIHGGLGLLKQNASSLWKYNISSKQWLEFKSSFRPFSRYFHAAAASSSMNTFFVHGGVLEDTKTTDELWEFSPNVGWKRYQNHGLPALAKHTMTSCDGRNFLVIGGYNTETGYSRSVWNFNAGHALARKKFLHGYIPRIYGHSSVCDTESWHVYIIGGIQNMKLRDPEYNDILYSLNTLNWKINPIMKLPGFTKQPALHPAFQLSKASSSGIVVFVGDTSLGNMSADMWFYHYATRTWIALSPDNSDSDVNIPLSSSAAVVDGKHFLFGGFANGRITNMLWVVPDFDPCLLTEQNSTCLSSHKACELFYTKCDPGYKVPYYVASPVYLSRRYEPSCSAYRNCESCYDRNRNSNSSCRWCTAIRSNTMSKCIPADARCDELSIELDCDPCAGLLYPDCFKSSDCTWTKTKTFFKRHFKDSAGCQCQQITISSMSKWNTHNDAGIEACPESCSVFSTCKTCLQSQLDDSQHSCSWVNSKRICVDTQYVPIVCPIGGDCGLVSNGRVDSCPIDGCKDMRFCMECIQKPNCFWEDEQKNAGCRDIRSIQHLGNTTLKWYLKCPLENECLNGWDNCQKDQHEECQDVDKGYNCVCEQDYNRTSRTEPCKPICVDGCNNGICVSPGQCQCVFGYTGENCDAKCNCHGHSHCTADNGTNRCILCHNNTVGEHCEACAVGYVGDPTKFRPCRDCKTICNGRSDVCVSKNRDLHNRGPTEQEARCAYCTGNSQGDLCEKCKKGYFKLGNTCEKCRCNGHSDVCVEGSRGFCKCDNHTTSSDDKCNDAQRNNFAPLNCWTKQCDKCKSFYIGNPVNGGLCYRQIFQDQIVCFKSDYSLGCPSRMDLQSWSIFQQNILEAGRTTRYSIIPVAKSVDIVLTVNVAFGKVTLFLSNQMDYFRIFYKVRSMNREVIERKDSDNSRSKRDLSYKVETVGSAFNRSHMRKNQPEQYVKLSASSNMNSVIRFEPRTALQIFDIQNRLVVVIPHANFDMQKERFFVILLSQENSEFLWNSSNQYTLQEVHHNERLFGSVAGLMFRQDMTNMDLFVFFSFFFSCFLLILGVGNIVIKIRGVVNARRAHREQNIRMKHMAKRPFATVNILLNERRPIVAKNIPKKERCKLKLNVSTWIESTSDENSFFPSSLNVSTRIFCERPVTVYHQDQESGDIPLLNSTAKFTEPNSDGRGERPSSSKITSTFKRVRFKQTSTLDGILRRGNSVRSSRNAGSSGNQNIHFQEPSIIASEMLTSGLSVSTVLLQLPGPKPAQVALCLGSTILSLKNS